MRSSRLSFPTTGLGASVTPIRASYEFRVIRSGRYQQQHIHAVERAAAFSTPSEPCSQQPEGQPDARLNRRPPPTSTAISPMISQVNCRRPQSNGLTNFAISSYTAPALRPSRMQQQIAGCGGARLRRRWLDGSVGGQRFGPNKLYHNLKDGRFREVGLAAGSRVPGKGGSIAPPRCRRCATRSGTAAQCPFSSRSRASRNPTQFPGSVIMLLCFALSGSPSVRSS